MSVTFVQSDDESKKLFAIHRSMKTHSGGLSLSIPVYEEHINTNKATFKRLYL